MEPFLSPSGHLEDVDGRILSWNEENPGFNPRVPHILNMVTQTGNPSTWQVEEGGARVQRHP